MGQPGSRIEIRWTAPRFKTVWGGPGAFVAAGTPDLALTTASGSDFWTINASGDFLEINDG